MFWCHIILVFYTVHEVLTAHILGRFTTPSSSGSHVLTHFNSYSFVVNILPIHSSFSSLKKILIYIACFFFLINVNIIFSNSKRKMCWLFTCNYTELQYNLQTTILTVVNHLPGMNLSKQE